MAYYNAESGSVTLLLANQESAMKPECAAALRHVEEAVALACVEAAVASMEVAPSSGLPPTSPSACEEASVSAPGLSMPSLDALPLASVESAATPVAFLLESAPSPPSPMVESETLTVDASPMQSAPSPLGAGSPVVEAEALTVVASPVQSAAPSVSTSPFESAATSLDFFPVAAVASAATTVDASPLEAAAASEQVSPVESVVASMASSAEVAGSPTCSPLLGVPPLAAAAAYDASTWALLSAAAKAVAVAYCVPMLGKLT